MKQTEIGLIPDDWEVKRLGDITDLLTGYPFPGNEIKTDGSYRLLRGINITEGEIRHSEDIDRYYSGDVSPLKKYLLQENDLVIGMDGSKVGKNSAIISESDSNSLLVQRVARLREIKYLSSIEFIKHFINSYFFSNYVDSLKTSSAIPHISPANIKSFRLPFPLLAEQQQIAKALSDVDALISTTEKLLQKKKNIKQGAMQNLLTGKKRLPGFAKSTNYKQSELGPIPEDWEVKSLGEITNIVTGKLNANQQTFAGRYPFFTCGEEIYRTENYDFDCDAILLGGNNATGDFKLHIYSGKFNAYQRVYVITRKDINPNLFWIFINIQKALDDMKKNSIGSSTHYLTLPMILPIIIPFPSPKEQQRIANVLSSMDKEIETLNTKLEKYRNLKTAMMQQLLTGKIRLI